MQKSGSCYSHTHPPRPSAADTHGWWVAHLSPASASTREGCPALGSEETTGFPKTCIFVSRTPSLTNFLPPFRDPLLDRFRWAQGRCFQMLQSQTSSAPPHGRPQAGAAPRTPSQRGDAGATRSLGEETCLRAGWVQEPLTPTEA